MCIVTNDQVQRWPKAVHCRASSGSKSKNHLFLKTLVCITIRFSLLLARARLQSQGPSSPQRQGLIALMTLLSTGARHGVGQDNRSPWFGPAGWDYLLGIRNLWPGKIKSGSSMLLAS